MQTLQTILKALIGVRTMFILEINFFKILFFDFVNKFTSGKGKDDEELTFEDVDFEKADDDSNKEA